MGMRVLLLGLALLTLVGLPIALTGLVVERLDGPRWLGPLAGIPLGLVALVWVPVRIQRHFLRRELSALDLLELRRRAFAVHDDYFESIRATEDGAYRRLVELCASADLEALRAEWRTLERRFRQLEFESGHEGRPLIMDIYGDHRDVLDVLRERLRRQPANT